MQVANPLYDRLTAPDAIGPYEVLSRPPGAEVSFVAAEPGPKRTGTGALELVGRRSLAEAPEPEIVVVPGGPGSRDQPHDQLVTWIRRAHEHSQWTTSVCTGALPDRAESPPSRPGRRGSRLPLARDRRVACTASFGAAARGGRARVARLSR